MFGSIKRMLAPRPPVILLLDFIHIGLKYHLCPLQSLVYARAAYQHVIIIFFLPPAKQYK